MVEDFKEDENKERGNWGGRFEFLLTAIGYAVGLGNVWRFPYLCYRNGGGAFLIPYFIIVFVVGMPLMVLISGLGQFSSNGSLTCWEYSPIFKGIGLTMVAAGFVTTGKDGVIIAWSMYYTGMSFQRKLPWASCNNEWNTQSCWTNWPLVNCSSEEFTKFKNGTCYKQETKIGIWDKGVFKNETKMKLVLPSEEYYYNKILKTTERLSDFGTVQWDIALTYLALIIILYLCVFRGIKTSGKVVYFTATFPYFMLIILLIRGVTLPNAMTGIQYYLIPDFEPLKNPQIWYEATSQVIYSLSATGGCIITCASFNRFHHNFMRDAIAICVVNTVTSLIAGIAVFSFLGYTAAEMGLDISEVAKSGAGLAFVVYPAAISTLPISQLWSVLFFLMLITLGLDSEFVYIENFETSICDLFPRHLRKRKRRLILHTIYMIFFYLAGLLYCTGAGIYWVQLIDIYMSWPSLLTGLLLTVSLGWVYGPNNMLTDMRVMIPNSSLLKNPMALYLKICWIITPIILMAILLFNWIKFSPMRYGTYEFPLWAILFGWTAPLAAVILTPIFAIKEIAKQKGTILKKIIGAAKPSEKWGPALPQHRALALCLINKDQRQEDQIPEEEFEKTFL